MLKRHMSMLCIEQFTHISIHDLCADCAYACGSVSMYYNTGIQLW